MLTKERFSQALVLAASVLIAASDAHGQLASDSEARSLWKFVEATAVSADSADKLLATWPGSKLSRNQLESDSSASDVVLAGSFPISGALRVQSPRVRLDQTNEGVVRALDMDLSGACISRKQFKDRYPSYQVLPPPHPGDPDGVMWLSTKLDGTQIVYGFPLRSKDCLSKVGISPVDAYGPGVPGKR